ncbi:MAG: hypothetical protein ABWY05_14720 [Noviherbaspirillum sp.]
MNPLSCSRRSHIETMRPAGEPAAPSPPTPTAPAPASRPAPHACHAWQATWVTIGAFSLPTMIAPRFRPLMPPQLYTLRTLVAGLIYVDMIQPPMKVAFRPAPTRAQECLALTLGMMFYILLFALQARLSNTWCARAGSRSARMANASQQWWHAFCDPLPQRVRSAARAYPINFVIARVTAQMAAVGIGSTVSAVSHRRRGATLQHLPQPAQKPSLRQRFHAHPEAYLAGIAAFAGPSLMTLRLDRATAAAGGRIPPAGVALLTTAVVAACIASGVVHPGWKPLDAAADKN